MGVGAAESERAHRNAEAVALRFERGGFLRDAQRKAVELELRMRLFEVGLRRRDAVLQDLDGLDEPGDARRRHRVADVAFDGAQERRRVGFSLEKSGSERVDFDRVADARARAVGLEVRDGRR